MENCSSVSKAFSDGSIRALGQMISGVENNTAGIWHVVSELFAKTGRAKRIGFTGPPGAGKSTLIGHMIGRLRAEGDTVALLAVDPVSPFSGGSVLGDRIRLSEHFNDAGVYLRSLSTRGHLGGLSPATRASVDVCDAFGFDYVFVETVGVGQSEVGISSAVDLVVLVLVPEAGDGIQAMKSGIIEIADRFVINKSDRPGAGNLVSELKLLCQGSKDTDRKVITTSVTEPASIDALWCDLKEYFSTGAQQIETRRTHAIQATAKELVLAELAQRLMPWIQARLTADHNPYRILGEFKWGELDRCLADS